MRKGSSIGALAMLVGIASCSFRLVDAKPTCIGWEVIAPLIGTREGERCVNGVFTHPFTDRRCLFVPPAGVTACLTVTVQTP
jgi:hypothetical protein